MKALCVFSGGLDSILATQLIRSQGIDVLAIFFETPFFSSINARKSAGTIQVPFKVVDITERHLEVVKRPRFGYGANMNPCIDCHTLMFRIGHEMLEEEGAQFVITGEVLGQRPMSQNRKALDLIAVKSGLSRLLLRPLSAKHLPITLPEEKGWVNRDQLMDFQGRSRKPQMALAQEWNIRDYPSPAGGCLLTEKVFSRRLKDLLSHNSDVKVREIELLKLGRHFRLTPHAKLVVGKNKKENETIRSLSGGTDVVLTCVSVPGPTSLLSGDDPDEALSLGGAITASYGDVNCGESAEIRIEKESDEIKLKKQALEKEEFRHYMI